MIQIDKLTQALVESQKTLAKVQKFSEEAAAEHRLRQDDEVGENVRGVANTKGGETAAAAASSSSSSSSSSSEVAELRLQLSAAQLQITRLRSQLADSSKESRVVANKTWKSSVEVERMIEEQAYR
jgi:hypothetical protein